MSNTVDLAWKQDLLVERRYKSKIMRLGKNSVVLAVNWEYQYVLHMF